MIQIDIKLPNYAYECPLNDGETGLCNILGKGCYERRSDCPLKETEPVKHGYWIDCGWSIKCSECGYNMPFSTRNYCPNCGAQMSSEENK